MLEGKKIIYGVTGSVAAIKAPIIARELMRAGATVQIRSVDHCVHNLCADIRDPGRQHTGYQGEHGKRNAQCLVGAPDQAQGAAAVFEYAGKIAAPVVARGARAVRRMRRGAQVRRAA